MEFNWSTFILEMINFLVLVWILKRFFYMPVQTAISKRKAAIQQELDMAKKLFNESDQLSQKYENRLHEWEIEKNQKMKLAQEEIDEWKSKKSILFEKELNEERAKMNVREMQKIASTIEKNSYESWLLATKFASNFLKAFADSHLEKKIIDKFLVDISKISTEKILLLKNDATSNSKTIIQTAYTLSEQQKLSLVEKVQDLLNMTINITVTQNPELLAGLSLQIGTLFLQANLRDELTFFSEIGHEYYRKH